MYYTGVTFACFIFDTIDFMAQYAAFGDLWTDHTTIMAIIFSFIFVMLDIFYLVSIYESSHWFPSNHPSYLNSVFLGNS